MQHSRFVLFIVLGAVLVVGLLLALGFWQMRIKDDPYRQAVFSWGRSVKDFRADRRRKPTEILRFSGVRQGLNVVDLLGGNGYYTELLSHVVGPQGRVYLQNNSLFLRFSTEGLEKRLRNGRLQNVVRIDSEFADLGLPNEVDLIFMGLCYHDIYVPREDPVIMTSREEFFPQIHDALKSGGRVLVIDHAAEPGSGTSASSWHHRIAEDYAIADFQRAGFRYLGKSEILRNPEDDHVLRIWDEKIRGKTDRFVLLFEKN